MAAVNPVMVFVLLLSLAATSAVDVYGAQRIPGQSARPAALQGKVSDKDGRGVPGVEIALRDAQSGVTSRVVSNADGVFRLLNVRAGEYELAVAAGGFAPHTRRVAVRVGESIVLDITLEREGVEPERRLPGRLAAAPEAPRTPGQRPLPRAREIEEPAEPPARAEPAAEPAAAPAAEFEPMPNRWSFKFPSYRRYDPPQKMPWIEGGLLDPYNQNGLKADRPIGGSSWFVNLTGQLNSALNPRRVALGEPRDQVFNNQNVVLGAELFSGSTVFVPKAWAFRAIAVANVHALANGSFALGDLEKNDPALYSFEEAFAERRLKVWGPNFDFTSVRAGMQNFTSDFRGYVFSENQLGVRVFGNGFNNRHQYNIAWFSMRQRDDASQLHTRDPRNQNVVIVNYFLQDAPVRGLTTLFNVHLNEDEGFGADVGRLRTAYVGAHLDGHWGSWNLSTAWYEVAGTDAKNRISARAVDIRARMAAVEVSRDTDWMRYRASVFYASGDRTADDDRATGFDAISDNPNLAGGQFMFWTQQKTTVGELPVLSDKFSLLPNLRSKFTNRSNFVNPGLILVNLGVDFRISPQLKVITNASVLQFATPSLLSEIAGSPLRDASIGTDLGAGVKFRPFVNENLFFVGGVAALLPRGGFSDALHATSGSQTLFSTVVAVQIVY